MQANANTGQGAKVAPVPGDPGFDSSDHDEAAADSQGGQRIMRERECRQASGLSRSARLRQERAGTFPQRVKLGPASVGWIADEVFSWVRAKAAERSAAGRKCPSP
jgi:prophage regulatory protein